MALLLNDDGSKDTPWKEALENRLPDIEIRTFPDIGDPEEIDYAVIWNHPHGDLVRYPNLKAILLLGAGVDFLQGDELPEVPVVRLADEQMARDMAQYTLHWIIHFHREFHRYRRHQAAHQWQRYDYPPSAQRRVGILGLGMIGGILAEAIAREGFAVQAWVRTPRDTAEIRLFAGADQLEPFLNQTDILVNCLPQTPATRNLLDAGRLAMLPAGAFIINVGRGTVIDEQALESALDNDHIEAAALDVFCTEPLPASSWMWDHPGVFITPHISGITYARSAADYIVANIRRLERGEAATPLYDPGRGY